MEYLIGLILSVTLAGSAVILGFERERSFYATVLIAISTYYVLFAVQAGSGRTIALEVAVAGVFSAIGLLGIRRNLWLVVGAIAGHGVFDILHRLLIANSGVPVWWPGFCMAFDVVFGAFLGMRILRRSRSGLNSIANAEGSFDARP